MSKLLDRAYQANAALRGRRTYLTGFGFLVVGIVGWCLGSIDTADAIRHVLEGLGLIFLRSGMTN